MTAALGKVLSLRGDDASRLIDAMRDDYQQARRQHKATAGIAERNAMVIRAALERHVQQRKPLMARLLAFRGRMQ